MCMEACLWFGALIQVVSQPHLIFNSLSAPFTLIMTKLNLQESNFFQEGKIRLTLMECFKSLLFILFYILYYILLCSQDRPVAHCAVQAGWNLGTPRFCFPKAGLAGMCHRSHAGLWSSHRSVYHLGESHCDQGVSSECSYCRSICTKWPKVEECLVSGVWVFR